MTEQQDGKAQSILMAIDIAKLKHDILIRWPCGKQKSIRIQNSLSGFEFLLSEIDDKKVPIIAAIEPTADYHRLIAYWLAVSCILSSASLHDSQVAIPLAEMTAERVTSCYDLMDSAYDAPVIRQHSASLGHVPIIDLNPRTKECKRQIQVEQKTKALCGSYIG